MKLNRMQIRRLIMEAALNESTASSLKPLLDKIIAANKGITSPKQSKVWMRGSSSVTDVKGSKDQIKLLQQFLKDQGYNLGKSGPKKDGVDGDWGSKTTSALKKFQNKVGEIDAFEDGKIGPRTAEKMKQTLTSDPAGAISKAERSLGGKGSLSSSERRSAESFKTALGNAPVVVDSLMQQIIHGKGTAAEKKALLKIMKLSDKDRKAVMKYLKTVEEKEELDKFIAAAVRDGAISHVEKFMSGVDFSGQGGAGSKDSKREAFKQAALLPRKFARTVQNFYKKNPNSLKDTSQAISIGIRPLSKEQVSKIDIDNVELKGFGFGGKKRLYVPMKDGYYYEFVLDNKGSLKIDSKKSKKHSLKDFLNESRLLGESRGMLYRKRYRRY